MTKPKGRLGKNYRIMWDQNSGLEGFYNPLMSPEKVARPISGFLKAHPWTLMFVRPAATRDMMSLGLWPQVSVFLVSHVKGTIVYIDEKWIKIKGQWHYWFVVLDHTTGLPIVAELLKSQTGVDFLSADVSVRPTSGQRQSPHRIDSTSGAGNAVLSVDQ